MDLMSTSNNNNSSSSFADVPLPSSFNLNTQWLCAVAVTVLSSFLWAFGTSSTVSLLTAPKYKFYIVSQANI